MYRSPSSASELVISVKTVEYHLGSVFAKLGVTTGTELAARLAGDGNLGNSPMRAPATGP
jgi:DNA-binding CsgD family transcriptional regulator